MGSNTQRRARFDRFELDLDTGELWADGELVDLAPQPSRILTMLVAEAGSLVTRSELRRRIWGESWLDWEAALHQAIRRIRLALGDSATQPRFVATVPRRGYRFIAPLLTATPQSDVAAGTPTRARRGVLAKVLLGATAASALVLLAALVNERVPHRTVSGALEVTPAVQRLHREGLYLLERGDLEAATRKLRQASEAAPHWAAAWSALAEAEMAHPPGQDRAEARRAIERALARDAEDARAWRLLARLRLWEEWDWVGARGALEQAARVGPEQAEVWQLIAALETVLGREKEAIGAARRAVRLDPIATGRKVDLGWTLYYFGHLEQALAECRRGLELEPRSPWARQCEVQALLLLERPHEAAAVLGRSSGRGAVSSLHVGGNVDARIGQDTEFSHDLEENALETYYRQQLALMSSQASCASSAAAAAVPKMVLGDRDGALDALAASAEEGRGWALPFALVDPLLLSLRNDRRFRRAQQALSLGTVTGP